MGEELFLKTSQSFQSFTEPKHSFTFLVNDQHDAQFFIMYSGTSIYCSQNDRFPACTVHNFWSRIKFHINNFIFSRIHHSPNYRFTALIVRKSRSRRKISRMDRFKKMEKKYLLFALPSLWTINLAAVISYDGSSLRLPWEAFISFDCGAHIHER